MVAGGKAFDCGALALKTGTGGGRGGVAGGAFSLSVVDSWLDTAAFSGLGAASVGGFAVAAGGLGNSLIICARQLCRDAG